jgi:formylglycine-generating enzyme required for sulfatase activity
MKWLRVGAVVFGAVLITALGIDAADTLNGSRATLLGQVISSKDGCPSGMTSVPMANTFRCVDVYEASADSTCAHPDPQNEIETRENIEQQNCKAVSKKGSDPWRYITREEANAACMRAGKRLPKSDEWYLISVGTPDEEKICNISGADVRKSDADNACVSSVGAHDAIGNVWEWTLDDVIDGMYAGRPLPDSGYVAQVDAEGMAVLTNAAPSDLFYKDYFWSNKSGAFGVLRGGFYGSKSDAGVYAAHAETAPTTAGTAIGFRCVL